MAKSVVAFSLKEFDPSYTRVLINNADFVNSKITDLGTLEVITGNASFNNSQVENLGNLTTIGGYADFSDSKIQNLGNLTTIRGDADFRDSQVKDLGNLTTILGNAYFRDSQIESLGNLTTIGGSAYFGDSRIKNLGNLTTILGNAVFHNSQVEDLGNLTTIGGYVNFTDSQVEDLGNLTTIGGNAYFTNSQIESLGNLQTILGNANFRDSQIKDLGQLTTIGGDADFRGSQVKDLGKLKTIKGFVSFDNQELADQWKKRSSKDNFKTGGQSLSKTPAPKKDRVYGSKKNKPESSKDTKSAEKIEFNEKTLETIKNKVAEHNKKNPKKKVTLASAKAVVRRGMGAYSSTHRPTISGGKPNSRVAWGLARLNAFFYKIINGKSKSGKYSQDDDLINELGYKVQKYADGGELKHLKYKNEGAYADVLKVSKDEWHLSMIESEIEGQGYAKKIMNQIIQDARKEKVKKITLVTSLFNKDYFEYGYGFQETGYDEFNDLFEMELKLENGGEVANIMRNEIIDILSKNAQYGKQILSVQEVGLEVIESCIESNTYFGNAIRQANENYIMIPVNYEDKLWGIDKKVGYVYFAKPNENTKIRVEYKYDMQDYPVPILFDSEIMNSEEFYDFNDYEEIKSYKFDSEFLYRAINNDEMLSIIQNGFIKSNASMNIGKQQEETTSFAQHISQASSYAVGFNAWYDEVTFAKPKYILKVKKEGVNYKPTIETDIENEVDVYGEIPIQQIESIYEFRLGECEMGQVEIRVGYDNDFSDGSRSPMFKKVFVRKTDINSIIKSNKVQRYIDGGYLNNFVLYHGTGNANKVIQALKDDSFIFHKSAGVENGIYLTPNKKLALDYAIDTQGEDIGVLEIRFNETPNFKKYNNAGEQYYDERNYSSNPKEASIEYTKDLIKNNYDGYSTGDVYLLFKEKIDLIDINKISLVNNYSDGGDIQAYEEAMGISEFDEGGEAEEPTEFWGTEAGGVLVYCSTTQRYLILLRSEWVLEPNTWGIISGKLDDEENVQEAVLREAEEETGHKLGRLIPSFIFEKPKFKFHNFISIVDEEFIPELNWENTDYKWVKINEMPENLHFGLKLLLEKGDIPKLVANNVYVEKYADGGFVMDEEKGEKFINKLSELGCNKPLTNFQMNFFGFLDSLKDDCISLGGFWYDSNTTNYAYSKMGKMVLFDIEDFFNEKERTAFIEENYPTSTPIEIQPFDDDNYEFIGIGESSMGGVFRDKRDGSILKLTASPFEVVGTTKILNAQKKDINYEDNFAEIYSIQNIGKGVFKGTWYYKYYNEKEFDGNWFAIRREDITPFNEQEQKEANCVKEIIVNYYSMFGKNYQPEIFGSFDIYEPNREYKYLLRNRNNYSNGGLIAPNGKPSNLTPEQYKLVRTKAFKDWFGDWEKDPANASKVVDENGEPKVMWHYSPNEFTIFNPSAESRWVNQRKESVVWFGGNEKVISYSEGEKGFLYQCFLNVKKPIIVDAKKYDEYDYYKDEQGNKNYSIQRIKGRFVSKLGSVSWDGKRNENDGVIFYNAWDNISLGVVVAVPNPNQIKLADGTNTTFDGNNPDIRFMAGGELTNNDVLKNFVNQVEAYQSNHYGTFNRDNLVESYHKLPDSIKEKIKPISTKNLFRGADGTSYKSAISFTKNQDYAKMFGAYAFPFNIVKENKGLIDTKRLSALLSKMRIANEIGDDEGEVIVIEPIFFKDIIENIEKFRFDNGGLIAPNGKPSNLTPEQYKLVRTKAFKDWFGDWENDPENASKIVDENGEPLPVYHGSRSKFDIFDIQKSGESNTTSKVGFWFTSIKMFAENFANSIWYGKSENEVIYSVFLSVKNPKIYESEIISEKQKDKLRLKISDLQNESRSIQKKWVTGDWDYKDRMVLDASIRGSINEENFNDYLNLSNKSKDAINDGILISDINKKIKNIENKLYGLTYNDSYEKFRTDIYKVEGKNSEQANMGGSGMALSDANGTIKKYVNSLKNKGNDGIIIKKTRFDKSNAGGLNDQYVAFEPNQIKLADGSNTTFDGSNPDIRFMAGGQVLNLNKIRKGQYEAKSDKIEISLTNPKVLNGMGTNKWQLIIEYSNDIIVNQWFDTMNEALKTGAILLSDFLDSNNTETRFMAGGRTKKAKTDRSGNPIGDGNFHVDYFVEDMTEYPQVKISVSKSDSTESVYVRYFNEDNAESITLRFSMHENNAVKFGYQLNGYTASKNDILYELGLINRKFVPNTYLSITKRQVKKVDLPKYEESNLSIKEMYDLGEGADISMHKGKIAKGSNYLIQGDTVEKIIADKGRFEYFVNGGNVPKKRRRKKGA